MRLLLILISFLSVNSVYSQDSSKTYYFKDINWELTISSDFKPNDSLRNVEMQNEGAQLMKKSGKIDVGDLSGLKTLVSAFKGQHEYFNSTIRNYDEAAEGDYDSAGRFVNDALYNTFLKQIPDAAIDTLSTHINIDGLEFNKFELSLKIQNQQLFTMVILSKLYKGFDFGITYLYMNNSTKREIEVMLQDSKFRK